MPHTTPPTPPTPPTPSTPSTPPKSLVQHYGAMRLGMGLIWSWTAGVSWFLYPQATSLAWLHRLGFTDWAYPLLVSACVWDLTMGLASIFFATRTLWQLQFATVMFYSIAIAIKLPEFLIHPFGPITKNVTVLACLAYLAIIENDRGRTSPLC